MLFREIESISKIAPSLNAVEIKTDVPQVAVSPVRVPENVRTSIQIAMMAKVTDKPKTSDPICSSNHQHLPSAYGVTKRHTIVRSDSALCSNIIFFACSPWNPLAPPVLAICRISDLDGRFSISPAFERFHLLSPLSGLIDVIPSD